jgi:hypothetical protein
MWKNTYPYLLGTLFSEELLRSRAARESYPESGNAASNSTEYAVLRSCTYREVQWCHSGSCMCLSSVTRASFICPINKFTSVAWEKNDSNLSIKRYGFRKAQVQQLIESSWMNKVSLVHVSSCRNTGSIWDDPYWTSRKNSLEVW